MNNNIFEILNMLMNSQYQNNYNNQQPPQTNNVAYYPNDFNINTPQDNSYQNTNTNQYNNQNNIFNTLAPLLSLFSQKNSSFNILDILQNNNSNPLSLISSILNQQKNSPSKKGELNSKCKVENNYEEL